MSSYTGSSKITFRAPSRVGTGNTVSANMPASGLAFPSRRAASPGPHPTSERPENAFDEEGDLIDLLMTHHSRKPSEARWLAIIIARACIRPNHLWEDLGLGNRAELSELIARYFNPLFVKNTENMRWKKFFYKQLCEGEGLYICKAPVCTECSDYDLCFPDAY